MIRWRTLAVLLLAILAIFAGSAFPAGNFTYDALTSDIDRLTVTDNAHLRLTTAHSIVAWHRSSVAGIAQTVVARRAVLSGITWINYLAEATTANKLSSAASSGNVGAAAYAVVPAATTLADGENHALAVTFDDGVDAVGYVHFTSQATDATVATADNEDTIPLVIGGRNNTLVTNYFAANDHRGHIDGLRIWGRQLAGPEVAALSNRNFRPSRVSPALLACNMPMRGVPGENMGTVVDHGPYRKAATAAGLQLPTYSVSYLRGVR